jgi:hypothetical protein
MTQILRNADFRRFFKLIRGNLRYHRYLRHLRAMFYSEISNALGNAISLA